MTTVFSKSAVSSSTAGLNKRATSEELIRYIREDPDTIRYPNRDASIAWNGFELSQHIGEGFRQMEAYSKQMYDEGRCEALLRRHADDVADDGD